MATETVFYLVDAFTDKVFAGNPAAIVFLTSESQFENDEWLLNVSKEFNKPATTFLFPNKAANPGTISYHIKWFTSTHRIPLCGHGTLSASHVLFTQNPNAQVVEFDAGPGGPLKGLRYGNGQIELEFPSYDLVEIEDVNIKESLKGAFPGSIKIKYIGRGATGGLKDLIVVEVEDHYPLKGAKIITNSLAALYPQFRGIIITTAAGEDSEHHFNSRVFYASPSEPDPEDQVTGSAHCLLAPYWARKLGVDDGAELKAAQVSERGGMMSLVWKVDSSAVLIRSTAITIAKGTLFL